ncbi:MAG: hypothetical protein KGL39_27800 [Patescibacteria group bacterium]|nr:hypothetical protein [Patescibacteria group bacterium]
MSTRRGPGRPAADPDRPRNRRLTGVLTLDNLAAWREYLAEHRYTLSDVLNRIAEADRGFERLTAITRESS